MINSSSIGFAAPARDGRALAFLRPAHEDEVYRFLWLPTFQHPVAVRITRTHDGATLDVTELTGAGGYEPGTVGTHDERKLTNDEWESLQAELSAIDFWNMPTNPPPRADTITLDGAEWILLEVLRLGESTTVTRHYVAAGERRAIAPAGSRTLA